MTNRAIFLILTLQAAYFFYTSDRLEQILSQFSKSIIMAIHTSHPQCVRLLSMLYVLTRWGDCPSCLTEVAYEWCSVMCENYAGLADGENLLSLSLEIGFCHLDPQSDQIKAKLTHTEHHQKLADIIFKTRDGKAIADLLYAWTSRHGYHQPYTSLNLCARHLIGLWPASQRLRRLVIRSIELIGYEGFEQVGVEGFIELLNNLTITIEDMDHKFRWGGLLLDIIQSSTGIQYLSDQCWGLLAELAISESWWMMTISYSPQVIISLEANQEWHKLGCWMSVVWMAWPPEAGETTEEILGHAMLSLSNQQPGAIQRLEQWMEQWSKYYHEDVPESFQRICKQVHPKVVQQDIL